MASGDLIKFTNFSKSYKEHLIMDVDTINGERTRYAYVSSPSFYAKVLINKNLFTWGDCFWYFSYWNGTSWVQVKEEQLDPEAHQAGEYDYYFYHNSTLGYSGEDVPTAVLWEIKLYYPKPFRKRLWVYTGGIGCMNESTYNDIYKGKLIYSAGNLGGESCWNAGEDGEKRQQALSLFSQSANRGTLITASNEHKLVAYKFN